MGRNGDSDSIATIAGALIGASSTDPGFWGDHQLGLCLEPRYADEIDRAISQGTPVMDCRGPVGANGTQPRHQR